MRKLLMIAMMTLTCSYLNAQEGTQGRKLPSENIKTLYGETFNTQSISNNGNPIIISFFGLWCKPCKKELDAYNDNLEDWIEETGVKIIAVSIDDARSTAKVLPYVMGKNWEFEVLLDPNGAFKRAMSVNMIPHTFIINGEGNIVYQHTSYYDGLEDEIFETLAKVVAGEDVTSE